VPQPLRSAKGEDALAGQDLKRAATKRVFGFELLPAPFVVAHLQLGLLLQNAGARLSEVERERVGVYLTNALTGWEPPEEAKQRLPLPEFEEEREAAESVKKDKQILVIIGNPPYDGFADVAVDEERNLSTDYRKTKLAPKPKGQGLNNLYVRFFRMAERKIVEGTGMGVVCFISQYSWLDGLSHPGMRERYLDVFDEVWIDCLNGDSYKTGKVAPDGRPDPSIFSTETNPEGIQVGTAVALLVRKSPHRPASEVGIRFRNLWGPRKREILLATAKKDSDSLYERVKPALHLGLPFTPSASSATYATWPSLPELFPTFFPGVKTSRDQLLIDIDLDRLNERMRWYFDPDTNHEHMRKICSTAMESTKTFVAEGTRERLVRRGLLEHNFVRYCYRPFDVRWLYWEPETKLLDRNRSDYFPHVFTDNLWIEARQRQPKERFDRGYVTSVLADNFGNGLSSYFPLYLKGDAPRGSFFEDDAPVANCSEDANAYLAVLDARPGDLFHHAIALLHSPAYKNDHAAALRQDWPRLVLPAEGEMLERSANLGRQVAALLDTESQVVGVTKGVTREELRTIAVISRAGGGTLDPARGHLNLTAGWGFRGHAGQTMAGQGRAVRREYELAEREAITHGASTLGLSPEEAFSRLGESTYDVYLNDDAYWRNVPARVWEYTSGGYRVVKKWLSYREERVLGRGLEVEEAREVARIVRRIAAILLLGDDLDANYRSITSKG
jgi:predicted helicase